MEDHLLLQISQMLKYSLSYWCHLVEIALLVACSEMEITTQCQSLTVRTQSLAKSTQTISWEVSLEDSTTSYQ